MFLRIISGKLKPGTWDEFEKAYRKAVADAGTIDGLRGRWLTRDLAEPDSGTTISLWSTESAMEAYENSDLLQKEINARLTPFFSGEYRTSKTAVKFAEGDPAPSDWTK